MKKNIILIAAMILCFGNAQSKEISPVNNQLPGMTYEITATLDQAAKMISGTETITFRNLSNDTIRELRFHAYLNAFKNSKSTYFKESKQIPNLSQSEWGYTDIVYMALDGGEILTPKIKYCCFDDNNSDDRTVFETELSEPLLPGKEIKININFLSKLPKIIARSGYERGDFFMCGQWFPKLGVWEPEGMRGHLTAGWNCRQYHNPGDFYSDFANYKVSIIVPEGYLVGATGTMKKDFTDEKGMRTFVFEAEKVIDFAWAASPRFCIMTDTYNGKGIKLLYMPEHGNQAKRHLESVKHAMDYMQNVCGTYDYPSVTIIDVPFYAWNAAGYEYPMLLTTKSVRHLPDDVRFFDAVTVHGFVHNYFQAIVANNETEEAWLDEGLTSYFEAEIMDKYYGNGSLFNILSTDCSDADFIRTDYTQSYNPAIGVIDTYSWRYPTYTYEMLSGSKPAVMLQTLKGILGEENFNKAINDYYQLWKFKHPCGADFVTIMKAAAEKVKTEDYQFDAEEFFNQILNTDAVCDYKLTEIVNKRENNTVTGIFEDGINKIFKNEKASDNNSYKSSIFVQRMGTMIVPVEVEVKFENGDVMNFHWNGKGRCKEFCVTSSSKVVSARIDPLNKIACDINITNNSMTLEYAGSPVWKYTVNFLFAIQNLFQGISFLA